MASAHWIKVRDDIHEDPAVLRIAAKLKIRAEAVVGYCVRFWSWVSRNTSDGVVANVSLDSVEEVLSMPHFLHMLCEVGWLEYIEGEHGRSQIIIPNFERHLSEGAKARALKARQKQKERSKTVENVATTVRQMSPISSDKTATREDKIRLDKNRKESKPKKTARAPSLEEWKNRAKQLHPDWPDADAEAAWNYYESQNWMRGKSRITKWANCIGTCYRNWIQKQSGGEKRDYSQIGLRAR